MVVQWYALDAISPWLRTIGWVICYNLANPIRLLVYHRCLLKCVNCASISFFNPISMTRSHCLHADMYVWAVVQCPPLVSYQICKIAGCACVGNAGNFFPAPTSCVMHVPWCMPGSLTRGGGENVPGIPGACATCKFTYLVRGPFKCGLGKWHWVSFVDRD